MPKFAVGDRVFVYKPGAKTGKAYKFAKPFHGPYRILTLYEGGADVTLVDRPREAPIRVPYERLRVCPEEIPDQSGPTKAIGSQNPLPASQDPVTPTPTIPEGSVWMGQC